MLFRSLSRELILLHILFELRKRCGESRLTPFRFS